MHGRTRDRPGGRGRRRRASGGSTGDDSKQGPANWETVGAVRRALRIPVVGNGAVARGSDAAEMVQVSGCAGVMIATAALDDPSVFRRCAAALAGDAPAEEDGSPLGAAEGLRLAEEYIELVAMHGGPHQCVVKHCDDMLRLSAAYSARVDGAPSMRDAVLGFRFGPEGVEPLRAVCRQLAVAGGR